MDLTYVRLPSQYGEVLLNLAMISAVSSGLNADMCSVEMSNQTVYVILLSLEEVTNRIVEMLDA